MSEEISMNGQEEKKPVQPAAPASSSNGRLFVVGGISFLILVIAIIAGAGAYKVYARNDLSSFTVGIAKALHLPIAKIASTYIPYSEYAFDRQALSRMVKYDLENNKGSMGAPLSETDISNQVLSRLMSNVIIDKLATQYGVTAKETDIDSLKNEVLSQFKSLDEAEADLQKRYGWSMAVYEERVMKPFILQSALNEKVQADVALRAEVKKTAQGILDQIKQGASFEEMAKKYGEDGSAAQGGDLGWFGKGAMVPEFETVAFKLKKGELAPELIETQFGYHIVKTDETRMQKVKDAKGKMVNQEQVKARHILFRLPNLETVITKELKQAKIAVYGKVENPFKKLLSAPADSK